jgi:hypothetical protein
MASHRGHRTRPCEQRWRAGANGAQMKAFYVIISVVPEKSSRSMEGWPMRSCRVVKIVTASVLVLQLDSAGHMLAASSANARAVPLRSRSTH